MWGLHVEWVEPPSWVWDASLGGYRVSATFRLLADDGTSANAFGDWSRQVDVWGYRGSRRLVAAFTHTLVEGTGSSALYRYTTGFPNLAVIPPGSYTVDGVCIHAAPGPETCRPAEEGEVLGWTVPAAH